MYIYVWPLAGTYKYMHDLLQLDSCCFVAPTRLPFEEIMEVLGVCDFHIWYNTMLLPMLGFEALTNYICMHTQDSKIEESTHV